MKKLLLVGLFLLISSLAFSQKKRGLAYGYHSPKDLEVLSNEISWWYNWSEVPEVSVADVYKNYAFEFVPMTWNGNFNETKLRTYLSSHPDVKYLLAFNEPNFIDQANMKPSEVAVIWPTLEAIADDFNLKIVGPAVNYCGSCVSENGVTYNDPFKYLDDFFELCVDCRVDHIAVHSYMNDVGALSWYIGEFKKYGKPIWLTEFAGWESNGTINTVNDQISFMIGAVDFLESDPDVFRYAWFIGRGDGISNYPFIDILGGDGQLTALGEIYKQMPVHFENQLHEVPGRIEAEAYNTMEGILLEKTSDESGFANVGWIDAGDWLDYKINVAQDDEYVIQFRVAATKSAKLRVIIDGENVLEQNIPSTGGWQSWTTLQSELELAKGKHDLRLQAVIDGFNINWIEIGGKVITDLQYAINTGDGFIVYPNPVSNNSFKAFIQSRENDGFSMNMYDINGRKIPLNSIIKEHHLDISIRQILKSGVYFLNAESDTEQFNTKVVIK